MLPREELPGTEAIDPAQAMGKAGAPSLPDRLEVDVAIIGGGPAGCALATALAREGTRVAVFEKDTFPRHKLCGEFLSGEAVQLIQRLGCLDNLMSLPPAPLDRARFTTGADRTCKFDLPFRCFGVSRWALDNILLRQAREAGALVFENALVRRIETGEGESKAGGRIPALEVRNDGNGICGGKTSVSASLIVGAYGRRQRLDRQLGRTFLEDEHHLVGIKRHYRPAGTPSGEALASDLAGWVEIHTLAGGYCGICFIEQGQVNVCALLDASLVKAHNLKEAADFREVLGSLNPHLNRRLGALVPVQESALTVAGIPLGRKERFIQQMVFIGDAAGAICPFSGDGQAIAIRSALLLADIILGFGLQAARSRTGAFARKWDSTWKKEFAGTVRWGRILHFILVRPFLARAAITGLRGFPRIGRVLAAKSRQRMQPGFPGCH